MSDEVKPYIILRSPDYAEIEEKMTIVSAQAYYLKFFEVTDQYGYVAVMSAREPDKYQNVTMIEDVSTTQEANALLEHGWTIAETWKDKIRMILRKENEQ